MGRSPCCSHEHVRKGAWTIEEDQKLKAYIHTYGPGSWRTLPNKAGLERCGKSCRMRWFNYLRPGIKRGQLSREEEHTIIRLHALLGNSWSGIAKHLPNRTDNDIKNYWHSYLNKNKHLLHTHHSSSNIQMDKGQQQQQQQLHVPTRFSTSSARLLNKMANSFSQKVHGNETAKAALSKLMNGCNGIEQVGGYGLASAMPSQDGTAGAVVFTPSSFSDNNNTWHCPQSCNSTLSFLDDNNEAAHEFVEMLRYEDEGISMYMQDL